MTSTPARNPRFDPVGQLDMGREIIRAEADALQELAARLGDAFLRATEVILRCRGNMVITGMGKAGLIGQKIAATMASTGTPSQFIHPAEALHGDLGRVQQDDAAMVLSNSGETEEVVRLLDSLIEWEIPVIALTSRAESQLATRATVVLDLGVTREACSLGLAPSTSTTAMLALGDAVALVTSRAKGFTHGDFARFHPGGSLGRKLAKIPDVMRSLDQCCVAADSLTLREIYVRSPRPRRRSGAILLTEESGKLTGIFTDSDLARLFEKKRDSAFDRPIRDVMTATPITVPSDTPLVNAVDLMASRKISELPVVDSDHRPLGLIDITDVLGFLPHQPQDTPDSDEPWAGDQRAA